MAHEGKDTEAMFHSGLTVQSECKELKRNVTFRTDLNILRTPSLISFDESQVETVVINPHSKKEVLLLDCPCHYGTKKCICSQFCHTTQCFNQKKYNKKKQLIKESKIKNYIQCKDEIEKQNQKIIETKRHLGKDLIKEMIHPKSCLKIAPLSTSGEVVIDKKITRVPKLKLKSQRQWIEVKYRNVGTSCSRILNSFHRNFKRFPKKHIPNFKYCPPDKCIEELGKYLGVTDFETNYISFWMLDILALAIRRCQFQWVLPKNQKIFLLWFKHVWKAIQFTNSTRREIFDDLDKMLFKAANYMQTINSLEIPIPEFVKFIADVPDSVSSAEFSELKSFFSKKRAHGASKSETREESDSTVLEEMFPTKNPEKVRELEARKLTQMTNTNTSYSSAISNVHFDDFDLKSFKGESETTVQKNILSDLVIVATQLYYIFAEKSTHNLIATLCRQPVRATIWPITKGLNYPKKVGDSPYGQLRTDYEYFQKQFNDVVAQRQALIKFLVERYRRKRGGYENELPDELMHAFKLHYDLIKHKSDESILSGENVEKFNKVEDNDKRSDESIRSFEELYDVESEISFYDPDLIRPGKPLKFTQRLLPLRNAISENFYENYVPLVYTDQLETGGDPILIEKKHPMDEGIGKKTPSVIKEINNLLLDIDDGEHKKLQYQQEMRKIEEEELEEEGTDEEEEEEELIEGGGPEEIKLEEQEEEIEEEELIELEELLTSPSDVSTDREVQVQKKYDDEEEDEEEEELFEIEEDSYFFYDSTSSSSDYYSEESVDEKLVKEEQRSNVEDGQEEEELLELEDSSFFYYSSSSSSSDSGDDDIDIVKNGEEIVKLHKAEEE